MTREEMQKWLMSLRKEIGQMQYQGLWHYEQALTEIIDGLSTEPLTFEEQCVFLSAMKREREVCQEGGYENLMPVCQSIEAKVKKTLWE